VSTGSIWLRMKTSDVLCEPGNETSGSINCMRSRVVTSEGLSCTPVYATCVIYLQAPLQRSVCLSDLSHACYMPHSSRHTLGNSRSSLSGLYCLYPLEHWDCVFESDPGHGCMSTFLLCCVVLFSESLQCADPQSNELYQIYIRFIVSELILNGNWP
jgi:hypothetical protein